MTTSQFLISSSSQLNFGGGKSVLMYYTSKKWKCRDNEDLGAYIWSLDPQSHFLAAASPGSEYISEVHKISPHNVSIATKTL